MQSLVARVALAEEARKQGLDKVPATLNQLMLAQATGGAIRGAVRADFFWGFGNEATAFAGRMRQSGKMWVLLPNGYPLPAGN